MNVKNVQESIEHFGGALLSLYVAEIPSNTKSLSDSNRALFNGKPGVRGQFPYFALIIADFGHFKITCGGSLIHPQWVLTAAHGAHSFEVHLGALTLKNVTEPGRVIINATSAFYHPLMFLPLQLHDIGLIRLDRLVQLSDTI